MKISKFKHRNNINNAIHAITSCLSRLIKNLGRKKIEEQSWVMYKG
jgi:hypothetical protein